MGAAQSIPVVGETVTVIDSGVKIVAAASCALAGEILDCQRARDDAKKFAEAAGKSWVEYSERNVIAAPTRAYLHAVTGDTDEASRVMKKMGNSVVEVIDNTPVVGHAKGVVHYIAGDTERGHACMKGASRTVAVAGVGALTGGLGGGAVLAGVAAASSGVTYDTTVSIIQSSGEKEKRPYGVVTAIDNAVKSAKNKDGYGLIDSAINIGYTLTGDFATGAAAGTSIRKLNKASKERRALKNTMGEKAAKDTIGTAKKFKKEVQNNVKGDAHVMTKTKDLRTGKEAYGTSKRCRQQIAENEFKAKGKESGYNSVTEARKGKVGEFPRAKGILEKRANEVGLDVTRKVNRALNACAEHEAFENLGCTGDEAPVRTVSVEYRNKGYRTVPRCDNCEQFGDLMGHVATDGPQMPVPTRQFVLDRSLPAVKSAALYAGAAVVVCAVCGDDEDDCTCLKTVVKVVKKRPIIIRFDKLTLS
ncbi:uncharacterized protein LOC134071417 [Sardina pilchardus]|uniref:uncharacterized protein LOC134071417 n=1 Tax=Sardina pilchardus TaxID=27697 RepID=UPI002E1603BB